MMGLVIMREIITIMRGIRENRSRQGGSFRVVGMGGIRVREVR
jgi:hypothetical protein